MMAMIVVATIEIRIAPLTFLTHSVISSPRPSTKTSTGQPCRLPDGPSWTGTVVLAASGIRRTKPASTKPISAMNSPMPTEMAIFSCPGTAWKTASRKPVSTRTRITRPSRTMRPIASAQVICEAIENATNAFSPRPVASASGKFATTPIRIVITPATSAVPAAIMARLPGGDASPRNFPSASWAKPRISGFSTMM